MASRSSRSDAFLASLREAHAETADPDTGLIPAIRGAVGRQRDLVLRDHALDGLGVARGLAAIVDAVIQARLDGWPENPPFAALATGGYGRGELSPFSDVDLMLVVPATDPAKSEAGERAGELVRHLWDVGYEVGHAVRTLDQCAEMLRTDLATATAIFESRLVAGDEALADALLSEVIEPWREESADAYVAAKIDEAVRRHEFYGGSPCIVEPNLKESPGGLRDLHVAQWVARARGTEIRPSAVVMDAYAQLHAVRHALHLHAGRRQDVLDGHTQVAVASLFVADDSEGPPVERFMRRVVGSARRIHEFLEASIARDRWRGADHPPRRPRVERRELWPGLVRVGDGLFLGREDVFDGADAAVLMMRAFALARRHRLAVDDGIVVAVRRRVAEQGQALRSDPEVAAMFRSLLTGASGVAPTIRAMHRAALLGELIPEFGALTDLVRVDGYHRYTVDEHSLRVLEALESFGRGGSPLRSALGDEPGTEYRAVIRLDLLRLAALLHDIGKAAGPDHRRAGASRALDAARRFGLGERDAAILFGLVENHDLIGTLAESRVIDSDERDAVVARIGSAGRLRMLYLLGLADIAGVTPGALTGWRYEQIRGFTERLRERLAEPAGRRRDDGPSFEERLGRAVGADRRDEATEHARLMSRRYRVEIAPADAVGHLDLIAALGGAPAAAALTRPGELWIATRDRPARFAELAGLLTAAGWDVRAAEAFTRRDGIVLDVFRIADDAGEPIADPVVAEAVATDVAAVEAGDLDVAAAVRRRISRFRPAGTAAPVTALVEMSNKISTRHTVIDVVAGDRPGLLFELARCLASHRAEVHFARIGTKGARASDAFYVTRDGQPLTDEDAARALRSDLLRVARGT